MFFHGIDYEYILYQYPILSPRLTILRQNKNQHSDRVHLIDRFGFEPVHFLESSDSYTKADCLDACFRFGNVVFLFEKLELPLLQLSEHEVGVPVADTRKALFIIVKDLKLIKEVKKLYPNAPIFFFPKTQDITINRQIVRWRNSTISVKIRNK